VSRDIPHRIHLKGGTDEDGVILVRTFHWPTAVTTASHIELVIDSCPHAARVSLNGAMLGEVQSARDQLRADVTSHIRPTNELGLTLLSAAVESRDGVDPCAVRLEIADEPTASEPDLQN